MTRFFSLRLGWLFASTAVMVIPAREVTASITKEFQETFAVASEGKLVVDATAIELSVTATDRTDIAMHMVWNAGTDDAEEAEERFDRLSFEPNVNEKRTLLKLEQKKAGGWFSWARTGQTPSVLMELQVPRTLDLLVDTSSGEVVVRGVAGDHRIDTTSADIELENCPGDHYADTTSGDIVIRGSSGHHRADTTSGRILIEGGRGDIIADSTSGDIRIIDFPGAHRADSTSGSITATLGSVIDRDLRFDTVSGSLVILVPAALAAHFELDTVSGDIRFEVPEAEILRKDRNELSVRTHGGERSVLLETVSGDITVRVANAGEA